MRPCSLLLALFLLAMPTVSLAQPDESERRTGAGAPLPAITETALDAVSCSETVNRGAARYVTDASPPGVFFCIEGEWVRLGEGSGFSLSCSATGQVPTWDEDGDTFVCDTPEGGGDMLNSENLSGLTNTTTARSNLGLGNAATLDVGTTTGTVAAGDDARLSDTRTPTDNSVTSAKIANGAIVDEDINASAEIAGSKIVAASGSVAGVVTTGTQTFAGAKTFTSITSSILIPNSTGSFGATDPLAFLIPSGVSHAPTALRNLVIDSDGSSPAWADGWLGFYAGGTPEAMRVIALQADRIPADGTGSWLPYLDDADGVWKAVPLDSLGGGPELADDGEVDGAKAVAADDLRVSPTVLTPAVYDRIRSMPSTGHAESMATKKYFACNPANTAGCDALREHDMGDGDDANTPCTDPENPCETLEQAMDECPRNGTTACYFGGGDVFEFANADLVDQSISSGACTSLSTPCVVYSTTPAGSTAYLDPTDSISAAAIFHVIGGAGVNGAGGIPNALFVIENLTLKNNPARPLVVFDDGVNGLAHRVGCEVSSSALGTAIDCVRGSQDSKVTAISSRVISGEDSCWKAERGAQMNLLDGYCEMHGNGSGNYAALGGLELGAQPLTNGAGTATGPGSARVVMIGSTIRGLAGGTSTARGAGVQMYHTGGSTAYDTGTPRLVVLASGITGFRSTATSAEGCVIYRQAEADSTTFEIDFVLSRCADSDAGMEFDSTVFVQPTNTLVRIISSVFDLGSGAFPVIKQGTLGGSNGWIDSATTRWVATRNIIRDDASNNMFSLRVNASTLAYADIAAMRSGLAGLSDAGVDAGAAQFFADYTEPHGTREPTAAQLAGPRAVCDAAQECAAIQPGIYTTELTAQIPPLPSLGTGWIEAVHWPLGGGR